MRIASEIKRQWHASEEEAALSKDLIPARDYSGLNVQDTELRVWLPDKAKQALGEISERLGISMTVYLTEFFASYLFGIREVMRMRDEALGIYEPELPQRLGNAEMADFQAMEEPEDPGPKYDDPVSEMGKNIFALKIFLPGKIKDGLKTGQTRPKCRLAGLLE